MASDISPASQMSLLGHSNLRLMFAGQIHAEQASPIGVRFPAKPDTQQDHQCPGPFSGGPGLLHRVFPHPRGCRSFQAPEGIRKW